MTQVAEHEVSTITLVRETEINAPPATVFDAVLAEMGPEGQTPDGTPFPMVLEPFPGGRWYRDLGNGAGHWWGTVQVIKPPTLLEISGPLFMSYPAISHVQYRLRPGRVPHQAPPDAPGDGPDRPRPPRGRGDRLEPRP